SIQVTAQTTAVTTPPTITSEPVSVLVSSGSSCAFSVAANGVNVSYQWHRYGTNLANGGNISGATDDLLIISPASAADAASGANGYWVTVTGAGPFSTNSFTNSLSLVSQRNLVWSGSGSIWDIDTTADWLDGASAATFHYGDNVTFDDTGAGGT